MSTVASYEGKGLKCPIHESVMRKAHELSQYVLELRERSANVIGIIIGDMPKSDGNMLASARPGQIHEIDYVLSVIRENIEDIFTMINALERGE